jgi:phage terminase large subunit
MTWIVDYKPEFLRRLRVGMAAEGDMDARMKLLSYYKTHCVEWINDWCVTFDPRNEPPIPKMMPFKLFPKQVEFVQFILSCLHEKEDGLCEKSRDMGITWLCCAISVWLWLFHKGSTVGWGSVLAHNIDDRGNPKSIFLKIRQIIANIPPWMRPAGYDERWHAPSMKILHPNNTWGSTIIGEGGTNIGRGGRTSIYFKDESAHYEQVDEIEASLSENTNVQIDFSSVNGTNNPFYRKRIAGVIWTPGCVIPKGKTRVFIFDWRDNPLKSQEWYEVRRRKFEENGLAHVFAQEVDRNYSASIERIICPPEWVNAAVDAHKVLGFVLNGSKVAGQDIADGGGDKNALAIAHGSILRYADHWGGDAGDAAKTAIPICSEYGVRELYYDSIGVGAGFKNEINNMKTRGGFPPRMLILPWNAGSKPMDPEDNSIPGDSNSTTNEEQYSNLKAQAWFRMRARFYKTYRAVRHGEKYRQSDLISLDSTIPRIHELKNELSQAQHKAAMNGKIMVDKKPDGASSPNLADAVVMCFNPARELSIFDVL